MSIKLSQNYKTYRSYHLKQKKRRIMCSSMMLMEPNERLKHLKTWKDKATRRRTKKWNWFIISMLRTTKSSSFKCLINPTLINRIMITMMIWSTQTKRRPKDHISSSERSIQRWKKSLAANAIPLSSKTEKTKTKYKFLKRIRSYIRSNSDV